MLRHQYCVTCHQKLYMCHGKWHKVISGMRSADYFALSAHPWSSAGNRLATNSLAPLRSCHTGPFELTNIALFFIIYQIYPTGFHVVCKQHKLPGSDAIIRSTFLHAKSNLPKVEYSFRGSMSCRGQRVLSIQDDFCRALLLYVYKESLCTLQSLCTKLWIYFYTYLYVYKPLMPEDQGYTTPMQL